MVMRGFTKSLYSLGGGGAPYDNYTIIYPPPNPILIIKAPTALASLMKRAAK